MRASSSQDAEVVEFLPDNRSYERTRELLHGAYDIHVHAGPHLKSSPRRVDPFQAAVEARDAGMRGLVYMDVFEQSAGTAWLVQRMVPGIDVYGGLILNTVYGGINPRAVKTAMAYGAGAKFVSFGAHSTLHEISREGKMVDGMFQPLAELFPKFREQELPRAIQVPLSGSPDEELAETLEIIAAHPDVYLNTGHVSAEEAVRLVQLACEYGIKRILVASSATALLTSAQREEVARHGAFLEYTLAEFTHTVGTPKTHYYVEKEFTPIVTRPTGKPRRTVRDVADQIRAVGAKHCIIATDFGMYTLPSPVEGLRGFLACLLDLGLSEESIHQLVVKNPETLLGRA